MPIYEYRCNQCEREFEKYVPSAAAAIECPGCRSARVTRRLSLVSSRSMGSPASAPTMSGGGGGCCGGGCGCH
jgi:putative FmdB family regulatory protein